jgi:hypothetical protein
VTERPQDILTFHHVPTGVTGIPRLAEWDAVVGVEIPELDDSSLAEFEFRAPAEGPLEAPGPEIPAEVLARIGGELDEQLERPYEGRVVRQQGRHWAAGAVTVRTGESVELPGPLPDDSLEVVRTPDGDLVVQADGEPLDGAAAGEFEAATAELERLGRARFESFVVRADRAEGGGWRVTVDPL